MSTEMVEERMMIDALMSGRRGDKIAARHLMYVMMNCMKHPVSVPQPLSFSMSWRNDGVVWLSWMNVR